MNKSKTLEKQSKAKRIKILLKHYDRSFKEHQEMANFKEPVLLLMRNTRKVEFYDDVTTGWFQYIHTDGTTRKTKLSPEFLQTFDYGKKTFKGYILDENHPTPYPEDPLVTAEQFQWAIDKTQQDLMNHKAKEITARGDMWYKIIVGIAIIIGVLALAKLLVPNFLSFGGKEVVETVTRNISTAGETVAILP